ncbi:MAG: hypothetical protein ACFBSG_09820 [Leptolyngbyaceae cyanobacterium]
MPLASLSTESSLAHQAMVWPRLYALSVNLATHALTRMKAQRQAGGRRQWCRD